VARPPARRLASIANDILPASITTALHERLVVGGMYADERWIARLLSGRFAIESVDRFASDVHLHGRCVARRVG
jgi:hypothetical protein